MFKTNERNLLSSDHSVTWGGGEDRGVYHHSLPLSDFASGINY